MFENALDSGHTQRNYLNFTKVGRRATYSQFAKEPQAPFNLHKKKVISMTLNL